MSDQADHRPNVYREDGKWVFRASSFGACDQALVREALGQTPLPPPDSVLHAYGEGIRFEADILAGLGEFGWRILDPLMMGEYGRVDGTGQLCCELAVGPRAVVRCHPDGVAVCYRSKLHAAEGYGVGSRRVVEAKALKKGAWRDPLTKPQYAWQMSIEMAVTGLPGCFVVGWKTEEDGAVVVRDVDIDPLWVDEAPFSLGQIKARARHLVKLIEAGERPACSWAMWPCGFYPYHDEGVGVWQKESPTVLPDEEDRHARAWVCEWRKAKKQAEHWKTKEDRARQELLELLSKAKVNRWQGAGAEVTRVDEGMKRTFDLAAAKKGGVEVEKWMKETKTKGYLKIKEAGEGMAERGMGAE